jgi:addiction module HigA family antidote
MLRFFEDKPIVSQQYFASHHGCPVKPGHDAERVIVNRKAIRPDPTREPTHPGAMLREDVLPAIGDPVMAVAKKLGVTRQHLHRILAEKAPVTPDMALRIGKFCGNGPDLWLRMQQAYDLWHAERALRKVVAKIPTAKARAA